MQKRFFRLFTAITVTASVLIMQSCITDLTAMRAEINNLKQDSYQSKKDIAALKSNQDALKRDVGTVKGQPSSVAGEDSLAAMRASQADLYSQVSDTLNEMQQLGGRFDERSYAVDKELKQLSAEIELVKSRIDTLQGDRAKGAASAGTMTGGTAPRDIGERLSRIEADIVFLKAKLSALESRPAETPAEGGATQVSPEEDYKKAYALYKDGKFPQSREAMQNFLEVYASHPLAGNAQFWIGEAYYREKDYASAILAYEEVIKKYKDNSKVPAAMLKQGYAFANMGEKDAARAVLRDVMEKYPGSDLAKSAKNKLDSLK